MIFDPVAPSSMPMAVPGAQPPGPTGDLALVLPPPGSLGAPPQQGAPVTSRMGGMPMFPPMDVDPAAMEYHTETQDDGSILLRMKNPDGTPGRVLEVLRPPKPKGAAPKA